MTGFIFRNIHSSTFDIEVRNIDRSVVPELRRNEFVVPGRHGTIDYGNNTYENRFVIVELGVFENVSANELRLTLRDIAKWLSGKGVLIFDDEPDKVYQAKIYNNVAIDVYGSNDYTIDAFNAGVLPITFECQPFAESLEYRQVNIPSLTINRQEISADVIGTSESCPIITIKNIGTTTISNIKITRKVEI